MRSHYCPDGRRAEAKISTRLSLHSPRRTAQVDVTASADTPTKRWTGAWPDAAAFMLGLVLAWRFQWGATDLVWSLWLSSLVVGYALIVWKVSAPLREMIGNMAADKSGIGGAAAKTAVVALVGVGTLFGLAFYTVHFGGFHFVHSMFLRFLFPVTNEPMSGFFNWSMYAEVFSRYWWFCRRRLSRNAMRSVPRRLPRCNRARYAAQKAPR